MVKEGRTNVKRRGPNIRVRTGRKPRGRNSAQKRRSERKQRYEMQKRSEKKRSKRKQKIKYHLDRLYGGDRRQKTHKKRVYGGAGQLAPAEVKEIRVEIEPQRANGFIQKDDGTPYTVYTPFKRKWLKHFKNNLPKLLPKPNYKNLLKAIYIFPSLEQLGFEKSEIQVEGYDLSNLDNYENSRNIPSLNSTSYLGPHLRFGTVSVREVIRSLNPANTVFLSELIWREFFIQILWHFPHTTEKSFKNKYERIEWRNNMDDFKLWCDGKTGYPIVDAGMNQLNKTGFMHNRLRMVVGSFLCKHLLIDWRLGEKYFADKLFDYEQASNVGNWQWVAGCGVDAAPYFRIFNPEEQQKKFDKELQFIKKWIPNYNKENYINKIVDHKFARERCLNTYKKALNK